MAQKPLLGAVATTLAQQRLGARNRLVAVDLADNPRLEDRIERRVVRYALDPVAGYGLPVCLAAALDFFGSERRFALGHRGTGRKLGRSSAMSENNW